MLISISRPEAYQQRKEKQPKSRSRSHGLQYRPGDENGRQIEALWYLSAGSHRSDGFAFGPPHEFKQERYIFLYTSTHPGTLISKVNSPGGCWRTYRRWCQSWILSRCPRFCPFPQIFQQVTSVTSTCCSPRNTWNCYATGCNPCTLTQDIM